MIIDNWCERLDWFHEIRILKKYLRRLNRLDLIIDNDYIEAIGESIDLGKIMTLENQDKQLIKIPEKVEDPRKINQTKTLAEPEVFEQTCIVPDLHPMRELPAITCEEEININM